MAAYYLEILYVHVGCVIASGSLFFIRGLLMLAGSKLVDHPAPRYLSYTIDTALLTVALMLTTVIHQYPFADGWLTAKVVALAAYIALGLVALRRGRTRRVRALAFVAALAVFGYIVSVALSHNPWGFVPSLENGGL